MTSEERETKLRQLLGAAQRVVMDFTGPAAPRMEDIVAAAQVLATIELTESVERQTDVLRIYR